MYQSYEPRHTEKIERKLFDETGLPWHQLPGETDRAFEAFEVFAELGYSRSLDKVALKLYGDDAQANARHIENWSDKHKWRDRVTQFDQFRRDNMPDFEEEQENLSRYKVAKALPDITDVAIKGALGRRKIDRTQGSLIMHLMKPAQREQAQINFHIEAPRLPDVVTKQFEVKAEDAKVIEGKSESPTAQQLRAEAEKLRPKF